MKPADPIGGREQAVTSFFAAMNGHDADAAAALVAPDVEIVLGPSHSFVGRDAVRELALQEDAELEFETVPVTVESDGDAIAVSARRVQRWRDSGDVAHEQDVRARFVFGSDRLITRAELS